jgi:hypothetical protein
MLAGLMGNITQSIHIYKLLLISIHKMKGITASFNRLPYIHVACSNRIDEVRQQINDMHSGKEKGILRLLLYFN